MVQQPKPMLEAHFSIAFCAYKISRELARKLELADLPWTVEKAIGIARTILEIKDPASASEIEPTLLPPYNEEQQQLLKLFGW
jgi:hypothetical protein